MDYEHFLARTKYMYCAESCLETCEKYIERRALCGAVFVDEEAAVRCESVSDGGVWTRLITVGSVEVCGSVLLHLLSP